MDNGKPSVEVEARPEGVVRMEAKLRWPKGIGHAVWEMWCAKCERTHWFTAGVTEEEHAASLAGVKCVHHDDGSDEDVELINKDRDTID